LKIHFVVALLLCCFVSPVAYGETRDSASVTINHVRAVLDRKGNSFEVTEFVNLATPEGKVFSEPEGFRIPLPHGATGPRPMGEENGEIRFEAGAVIVQAPIDEQGYMARLIFDLPIHDGKLVLEQNFKSSVASAQIVSIWNDGKARLRGDNFAASEDLELSDGLLGQVMIAHELESGRIVVELKGIVNGPEKTRSMITLLLCLVLLLAGFIGWTRSRVAGDADSGENGRQ
jgi:hypothetical protein